MPGAAASSARSTTTCTGNLTWVSETAARSARGEVTAIGLVGLVFAGVGWVEALRSSQRAVWQLDQDPGHWIIRRLVDLGMLAGLGVLLALSLAMTAAIDAAAGLIARARHRRVRQRCCSGSSGPVLEFAVNLVLAAAAPGRAAAAADEPPPADAGRTPGGRSGIQLLNTIGRWYIASTEHRPAYQLVTGAVGLLVYLYLLNQLILFGAALAATATRGTVDRPGGGPAAALPRRGGVRPSDKAPAQPPLWIDRLTVRAAMMERRERRINRRLR